MRKLSLFLVVTVLSTVILSFSSCEKRKLEKLQDLIFEGSSPCDLLGDYDESDFYGLYMFQDETSLILDFATDANGDCSFVVSGPALTFIEWGCKGVTVNNNGTADSDVIALNQLIIDNTACTDIPETIPYLMQASVYENEPAYLPTIEMYQTQYDNLVASGKYDESDFRNEFAWTCVEEDADNAWAFNKATGEAKVFPKDTELEVLPMVFLD